MSLYRMREDVITLGKFTPDMHLRWHTCCIVAFPADEIPRNIPGKHKKYHWHTLENVHRYVYVIKCAVALFPRDVYSFPMYFQMHDKLRLINIRWRIFTIGIWGWQ